ncbi:MAG: CapA family protein [Chloroflexi bacterium]|nr:CapA family protein [Chloroflexota bacterium]
MDFRPIPSDSIIIHAVGDVGPRRVDYGEPVESLLAAVHEKLKEADLRFCQLEWNLSTRGCMNWGKHTTWYGRVHPDNVKSLLHGGFDVVSHASNHCFDYGPEALLETIEVLRRNRIHVIGVGKDLKEARRPAILERKGVKVGFLAYNFELTPECEAREEKPGSVPIRVSTYYEAQDWGPGQPPKIITIPLEDDVRTMEEDIRQLRRQVDVLVVSMHWGVHFVPGMLAMYQPAVGHRAIDAGADLIVGHHPHLIKGIEVYKGRVIFYSLGNFAMETPRHLKPPPGVKGDRISALYRKWRVEPGWERYGAPPDTRYSMVARCAVSKSGIQRVSFLPVWCNQRAEPEILSPGDPRFQDVLHYAEPWCEELGTTLTVEGDEVVVHNLEAKR